MNNIYKAKWIKQRAAWYEYKKKDSSCAIEFFKNFNLKENIKSAELSITALGVFNAYINGQKVGEDILAPGWTSYKTRLQYMTYDVTELLNETNNLNVEVGVGWRFHNIKENATKEIAANGVALLCSLTVEYENGKKELILSDESWQVRESKTVYNNIYNGETYDFTKVNDKISPVKVFYHPKEILLPLQGEPIREQEVFENPKLIITPKGEKVLDFGQEITGYVEFSANEKRGTKITLKHFEVLDKRGCVYTTNLRTARQKVKVIAPGKPFTYKPSFTFYGFRYVRVEGIENIDPANFKAIAVYSKIKRTSTFECSEQMLNQLYSNILWGQRGNFLDVPTDCPQRDERLGWTGDVLVFCKTAAINFNVQRFFDKWLSDLAADQFSDGGIPSVCPPSKQNTGNSSAGWADVSVFAPWELYLAYGDKEILKKSYPMMKKWVDKMARCAIQNAVGMDKDFVHPWKEKGHFGDWLSLDCKNDEASVGRTDQGLIATAYLARSTEIFVTVGKMFGNDMSYYENLYEDAVGFFRKEYMQNGRMKQDTQTACILALQFGLTDNKKETAKQLAEYVTKDGRLSTGFLGTAYILFALSDNGYANLAYDLLLKKDYPSWLYPISKGATTVWERWNGIHPNGRFANFTMNSFNHYAYGAVFGWMFMNMVGIGTDENAPGYSNIIYAPKPDKRISHVKGSIETAHGVIKSEYSLKDGEWQFNLYVPNGCTAKCVIFDREIPVSQGENIFSIGE